MCGIAGAYDLTGTREFPRERLHAMTEAIVHRGPDDDGFYVEPGVALGARRLSIVDLAGGHQPIANEDRSIWVAFNGELFEYPELRRDLLANGHTLSTRCDTEAWVHLYEESGLGMFERARGQFAVSLWDRTNRRLVLGRDRVGICPLYYAERDGWLLWGSEVKSLLASGLVEAVPDVKGIDHLFSFFCAGTTRTFFQGVKSLAPGWFLEVEDGRIRPKCYWDFDFPDKGQERRLDDPAPLIDEFEGLLHQSIERRLRGDVPVVSYISGGLDSTVVLGLATRQMGRPVPSFTIGWLNKAGPDERLEAAESAEALGSPLTTVEMRKSDISRAFPELITAAEGPVMDTSCAALMRLAQSVHSEGYKVALTGEGADEALAGYVWYKSRKFWDGLENRFGGGPGSRLRNLGLKLVGGGSAHRPARFVLGEPRTAQQDMYEMIGQARPVFFTDDMWDRIGEGDPYADLGLDVKRMERWAPLNRSLYVGYKVMLAGLLMIAKGDRISMNSSVETRYPFLDEDVIKFCSEISPDYKLHGWNEKWILRQVAARTLPKAIANRPKTMFRARMAQTFLGDDRPHWVDQLLSRESLEKTGYFKPEIVERERMIQTSIPRITPRRFVFDVALTCVVTTQLWHHIYCGGGLCDLPTWQAPVPSKLDSVGVA
jgi:asparagine synthase (glutamine-hydrolysing)